MTSLKQVISRTRLRQLGQRLRSSALTQGEPSSGVGCFVCWHGSWYGQGMSQEQPTSAFNMQQKRPLEFRVRDMKDEGGISEEDANRLGRYSADALVIIRYLADGDQLSMQLHAQNGSTQQGLGVEALFSAWLRLTAYIIAMPADADMKRRQGFLTYMLKLLGLDEQLQIIQTASGGPGSRDAQGDVAAPTSGSVVPQDPH